MSTISTMNVEIRSRGQQTTDSWNRSGCLNWWAAYDFEGKRIFLDIPPTRGDQQLIVTVTIPSRVTVIHIGCGKAQYWERPFDKTSDVYREQIMLCPDGTIANKRQ